MNYFLKASITLFTKYAWHMRSTLQGEIHMHMQWKKTGKKYTEMLNRTIPAWWGDQRRSLSLRAHGLVLSQFFLRWRYVCYFVIREDNYYKNKNNHYENNINVIIKNNSSGCMRAARSKQGGGANWEASNSFSLRLDNWTTLSSGEPPLGLSVLPPQKEQSWPTSQDDWVFDASRGGSLLCLAAVRSFSPPELFPLREWKTLVW